MSRMFGVEGTDNLHFAVYAKQLGAGLDEQLERFIREHPDTPVSYTHLDVYKRQVQKMLIHFCAPVP